MARAHNPDGQDPLFAKHLHAPVEKRAESDRAMPVLLAVDVHRKPMPIVVCELPYLVCQRLEQDPVSHILQCVSHYSGHDVRVVAQMTFACWMFVAQVHTANYEVSIKTRSYQSFLHQVELVGVFISRFPKRSLLRELFCHALKAPTKYVEGTTCCLPDACSNR